MKTPYKNIYTVLKTNRFIVVFVVSMALGSLIYSGWIVYDINKKALSHAFAINTNGAVIPLQWVDQKDNLKVEALDHLRLFHTYFYQINATNFEKNLEKALWLGNSSVDNVYQQKKSNGVYNRILQFSLIQKVISIDSKVDLSQEPYQFTTTTIFEINRGKVTDKYQLVSSGDLVHVDRSYPHNTHGLLITNYFENSLKKINNDNP